MTSPSHFAFRLATLLFATLLCMQCVWLLAAEISRPGLVRLPTNAQAATAAAKQRNAATLAALIGAFRGDLWAETAFTDADLLLGENADAENADVTQKLARVRTNLQHALKNAPAQPGAWLFRAGLALHYPPLGFDAPEALKMSYYTGPSEQDLIPARLRIAVRLNAFSDTELSVLVRRDLRLLITQKQYSAVNEAYNAASSSGKHFIEDVMGVLDPSALKSLRPRAKE